LRERDCRRADSGNGGGAFDKVSFGVLVGTWGSGNVWLRSSRRNTLVVERFYTSIKKKGECEGLSGSHSGWLEEEGGRSRGGEAIDPGFS
jgi:hypothetical protein